LLVCSPLQMHDTTATSGCCYFEFHATLCQIRDNTSHAKLQPTSSQ
jgi:hypothetical protein